MAFGLQFQLSFNPPSVYGWVCSVPPCWNPWSNWELVPFQLRSDPKQKAMPALSLRSLQLSSRQSPPYSLAICFQLALQYVFSLDCIWCSLGAFPTHLPLSQHRSILSQCIGFCNKRPINMFNVKEENLGKEFWSTGNAKKPKKCKMLFYHYQK